MKFTTETKKRTVADFYDYIANLMGHENTREFKYDCTKINIASNIQNNFFEFYREMNPELPANEANVGTAMLLACCGPKVDSELQENEVEVFDGFIIPKGV